MVLVGYIRGETSPSVSYFSLTGMSTSGHSPTFVNYIIYMYTYNVQSGMWRFGTGLCELHTVLFAHFQSAQEVPRHALLLL